MIPPAMETNATALRTRVRQLKLYLSLWLLVALLYGTMFVLTLELNGAFDAMYLALALATAGAAVLDVIWIRAAGRELRAIESR